ncbi:Flp pilus assembly complex ATPase component TadA, partial [bacterium]|nr:Flp pilus assembly complex ATPase component TadA [bacterium]
GLRSILRHDADIIMVGEVRDGETARVATWAALTGQLVFCTLHTNSAAGAISMMRNLGVESFLLANSLIGVVGQRLVRQLCPHCKKLQLADKGMRKLLNLKPNVQIGQAVGCDKCFESGYKGRTGLFELLESDSDIQKLILSEALDSEIEEAAIKKGMKPLRVIGRNKVLEGITTPQEVIREITI